MPKMSDYVYKYIKKCVHNSIPLNIIKLYDGNINESLIEAVKNNDLENIDISNIYPCSVLHIAVELNNIEMTKSLLKRDIYVDVRDRYKMTPLHYAVINNNVEIAELLIMNGANTHAININKKEIRYLTHFPKSQTYKLVDEIHYHRHYKYESADLIYAVHDGKYNVAKSLIYRGINLNYVAQCTTDANEYTALSMASEREDFKMVKLLIKSGADPNISGCEIYNALDRAIYSGNVEILQYLIEHGGVFDDKYRHNAFRPPIIEAVNSGNIKMVEYIIKLGEDINAKCWYGDMALHVAAYNDYEEIFKLLISYGADVNAKGDEGWTPLHYCAKYGCFKIARFMLSDDK